jgi:hypothetical protein
MTHWKSRKEQSLSSGQTFGKGPLPASASTAGTGRGSRTSTPPVTKARCGQVLDRALERVTNPGHAHHPRMERLVATERRLRRKLLSQILSRPLVYPPRGRVVFATLTGPDTTSKKP